ncbi:hypothetical protein B296_00049494, partial [Ensete ventricosum]
GERGGTSLPREETRHRLALPLEDDATHHSPAGRRCDPSFSRWKTMRRIVLPLEDDVTPRSPVGRQCNASSPYMQTRHHLVLPLEDEAVSSPRGETRRCLIASFPRRKMRRRLIPVQGDTWYRPIAGDPHASILSDRYVPPIPGSTDQNGEP